MSDLTVTDAPCPLCPLRQTLQGVADDDPAPYPFPPPPPVPKFSGCPGCGLPVRLHEPAWVERGRTWHTACRWDPRTIE